MMKFLTRVASAYDLDVIEMVCWTATRPMHFLISMKILKQKKRKLFIYKFIGMMSSGIHLTMILTVLTKSLFRV